MKPLNEKRLYVKPAMRVFELSNQPQLLAGSGGLDDYNRPDNPLNW